MSDTNCHPGAALQIQKQKQIQIKNTRKILELADECLYLYLYFHVQQGGGRMWVKSGETVSELSSKLSPISILRLKLEFAFSLQLCTIVHTIKMNCVQKAS